MEDDSVWGIVVSREEQETISPVTTDETFIVQVTKGEKQDSSARDTEVEIAQEEIPEAAASQTETEQIPVTSVPLRRSTRHSLSDCYQNLQYKRKIGKRKFPTLLLNVLVLIYFLIYRKKQAEPSCKFYLQNKINGMVQSVSVEMSRRHFLNFRILISSLLLTCSYKFVTFQEFYYFRLRFI